MKKVKVMVVLFAFAAAFAMVAGIGDSQADTSRSAVEYEALLPGADNEPVPMAECAKIECGTCPGSNCKIDGICCHVPDDPARPGMAECGCTADGEPVCECKVGVPR